ncbi:hypothetical protein [Streptomyces sp. NPDC058466]|uniref:hypothetical protein n=1 Tax=Streptomyces sp. NPDC058466 TaxID=3346512 RepID=UPI003651641E
MSGRELDQHILVVGKQAAAELRAAAVHVADRAGAANPHPLDDLMPKLAGRELAQDPAIAAGVLELLAALGIRPDQIRRTP